MAHRYQYDVSELLQAVQAGGAESFIRKCAEGVVQALVDAESSVQIGAGRYERTDERTTQRNGTREKLLTTAAGDLRVEIPKLREGSYFPAFLEQRTRIDKALCAIVMESYVLGVSSRKVDHLLQALGAGSGISRSEVSRICQELDAQMQPFRTRKLSHTEFPYVLFDATYVKGRSEHQIVSRAVVVATGISEAGHREVLGAKVGDTESEEFWKGFFRDLKARGLGGVKLCISDSHSGLKAAIQAMFVGAGWQRCRVHFMRNVLARVSKAQEKEVVHLIRSIFFEIDTETVRKRYDEVVAILEERLPKIAPMFV